ncbi:hypothetical protein Bca52824_062477 [Brassica carinata]|uniref:non-specific serine/threonine protein kinase n=1 Tax=Brassica carinata TaxID=52824 RepID=A0A8X7QCX9_BRACI|nr:hypothetical protein Bca52824_062477 [Brassica carinata]
MVVLLNTRHRFVLLLLATFSCFSLRLCFGEDRITSTTPIKDSETLLCKSGVFRFGFFTPVNSTAKLRYVGIWYDKILPSTTPPVSFPSSNGNLVVTDGRNRTLWSTNVTAPPAPTTTWVQLMDTGILCCKTTETTGRLCGRRILNSLLGEATKILPRGTTRLVLLLTFPELLIWKNDVPVWRSGPWNGQVFIGLPDVDSLLFLDGFNLNNDNQGTVSMSYANDSFMYHFNLDPDGAIYQRDWRAPMRDWRIGVRFPKTDCDAYGKCGPYGICNSREDPQCKCVKGFVPRNETEWSASNWRNGCVRRAPLLCERQRNASNGGGGGKGDGFLKLEKMKVPINAIQSLANEQACPQQCTDNCSCTAYAYDRGIGCMLWSGSLVDLQSFVGSGIDLNIRLAHSELSDSSRASGQGLEELMNEVVVISKLQHRNLVKLLGCCIEGEERLLVYEYMSKKSLDAYLFDPLKQKILDWKTRMNIIEGICRGLLYLHRDSRLKIIHRDLKASNILLDDNLNPKISDFGLARVFRANEDEANTRRVVGTYGYMSPEYAMEGLFSEKSDVFSLGVILLEIISGRRNSHKEENNLNLLAYAWKLWNEGEAASLADPNVFDESFEKEITKCVQIGLLCVQEVANDRPNVSTVIWMLTTENTNLKEPKQPAIIARRGTSEAESSDQSSQKVSINDVSLTAVTEKQQSKTGTFLFHLVAMVVLLNSRPCFVVLILLAAFSCFSLRLCFGEDRITFSTPIKDSESKTLLCKSGIFRFGFFTPANSTSRLRYVGIWYDKIPVQTVVWVANRDAPINDTSGVVSISVDNGNLVVTDGRNRLLWSTNVTVPVAPNDTWIQLMENGNLRLQDNRNNGEIIWESFKHPYSSVLPRMSLLINSKTGENIGLTSWRSYTDPSTGNYTVTLVAFPFPELLIRKNSATQWRSGPWNGQVFIGLPDMDSLLNIDGFNLNNDNQGTVSLSYANDSFMYHFNLDPNGAIYQRDWSTSMNDWRVGVRFPSTDCDEYNRCGPYGSCNYREDPQCKCIKGFVPRNNTEWSVGNWISGCVRRAPLRCERLRNGTSNGGKEDWFLKVQKMKVPVNVQPSLANAQACPKVCLDNCSCTAYAYDQGIGCMLWSGSLVDMQSFLGSGIDLYIRLSHSELKAHSKRAIMITALVLGVVFVSAVCVLLACLKLKKRPGEPKKDRSVEQLLKRMEEVNSGDEPASNQVKLEELPLFEFQVLATATDDFSLRSKLGQGGFGPVYKGKLPEGQEIAVKRLSRASGQGLEELMNEVVVISKLQHRNLVKLLGCCIEGEERLLVYEYMPKKSLDAYLFDPLKQKILDWKTRFNIMEGICRGLLYLHRDSRLKIIHRDLKASNILLDDNLNPKISDFGLARVFRANEDEANTRRVVGTYGYMSPEYAMEGLFSEKSDVFSLGVILLEIISGRKNSHKEENHPNLLAYVWTLWNEGEAASLADPSVFDESFVKEITNCVQIGLLCVQEVANDRPNVSTVIWMLTTENVNLPEPKQPAFITRREKSEGESSDQSSQKVSVNDVSLTSVTGR